MYSVLIYESTISYWISSFFIIYILCIFVVVLLIKAFFSFRIFYLDKYSCNVFITSIYVFYNLMGK